MSSSSARAIRVRAPRQQRSRETLERLLVAADRVLRRKSFDSATIAEMARAAGLTVGAFYARFPSKDALLRYVEERIRDDLRSAQASWMEDTREQTDLFQMFRRMIESTIDAYRKHRGFLRALVLRAREDAALRKRMKVFSRESVELVLKEVLRFKDEMRHPDPEAAAEFGILLARSALWEFFLFQDSWPGSRRPGDALLAQELARNFVGYVRMDCAEMQRSSR